MRKKKNIQKEFKNVTIIDAGAEGKAVARINDQVVFIPFVVPGDVCDIQIVKKRKNYLEGRAVTIHHYSDKRTEPRCEHFGLCGGCKWQNLNYIHQLHYKQKQVIDNLERIGKMALPDISPILPSDQTFYYRNKLEYTFSNRKWLIHLDDKPKSDKEMNGLGFHLPGMFDRILDINRCYLQDDPSNEIRLKVKAYAQEKNLTFYDVRNWKGLLRNIIIRNSSIGELMVIVVFSTDESEAIYNLMTYINQSFPQINALMYVINEKRNDDISDREVRLFKGRSHIYEEMPIPGKQNKILRFKIGPVSFFQTNTRQAIKLYQTAREFADLKENEIVYDLYTGTGTIANYVADRCKKVVGIEQISSAISDATENSSINHISNTMFYAGDIAEIFNDSLIEKEGRPDVVITDPPRAGMHTKVVHKILEYSPRKVVYISCNPATQARDVDLMREKYNIEKIQPVDMFPHTSHVENVILLKLKG